MTWARVDDLYDDKRKVKRAWRADPRAIGLHLMSITYTTRHQLDGRVPADWLEEMIPKRAEREKTLQTLVDERLFELLGDGDYAVHDYLDWNASAESRRVRSQAAKDAADRRWTGTNGNAKRIANGTA